jgi:hypothetical protein
MLPARIMLMPGRKKAPLARGKRGSWGGRGD